MPGWHGWYRLLRCTGQQLAAMHGTAHSSIDARGAGRRLRTPSMRALKNAHPYNQTRPAGMSRFWTAVRRRPAGAPAPPRHPAGRPRTCMGMAGKEVRVLQRQAQTRQPCRCIATGCLRCAASMRRGGIAMQQRGCLPHALESHLCTWRRLAGVAWSGEYTRRRKAATSRRPQPENAAVRATGSWGKVTAGKGARGSPRLHKLTSRQVWHPRLGAGRMQDPTSCLPPVAAWCELTALPMYAAQLGRAYMHANLLEGTPSYRPRCLRAASAYLVAAGWLPILSLRHKHLAQHRRTRRQHLCMQRQAHAAHERVAAAAERGEGGAAALRLQQIGALPVVTDQSGKSAVSKAQLGWHTGDGCIACG